MAFPRLTNSKQRRSAEVRVGFVPLNDCAPLVMAQELGLFAKYGLRVRLRREVGWATIRDKLCYGELDAAHALAPLALAMNLGLGAPATACLTGLTLNLEGNGITIARRFATAGETNVDAVRVKAQNASAPLLLGIPFVYSAHHFLLRAWLTRLGLTPERAARFVVVPPPQMPAHLKAGNLDGYCVGEPWNSTAILARTGHLAATSNDLLPGHPEKVLLARREFADERGEEHVRLIAALLEACRYCAAPENGARVARMLASAPYVNTHANSLAAAFGSGTDEQTTPRPIASRMFGAEVNDPSPDKAAWIAHQLEAAGQCGEAAAELLPAAVGSFRSDIFQQALRVQDSTPYAYETENELESERALA